MVDLSWLPAAEAAPPAASLDPWQVVALLLGSAFVAALVTGGVTILVQRSSIAQQTRQLDQQRFTENSRLMMDLFSTAHGRPNGRARTGAAENVGAIFALSALAVAYEPLENSVVAFLEAIRADATMRTLHGAAAEGLMSLGREPNLAAIAPM